MYPALWFSIQSKAAAWRPEKRLTPDERLLMRDYGNHVDGQGSTARAEVSG
jgi:hypothetical protein